MIIKGKWHKEFVSRLGFFNKQVLQELFNKKNVWIHAVSVGEVIAVIDLVRELKKKYSEHTFIFSTVTETGNILAKQHFPEDIVIYAPLDFSWIVRHYVKVIKPQIYLSAETEIWPNLYMYLKKRNIPIIQVNGRISDKAYRGYKRFQFLIEDALGSVAVFCMQSQIDADRIVSLGAPLKTIRVVGNLKFDIQPEKGNFKREDLSYSEGDLILMAGSTHPQEEQMIIDVYKRLAKEFPHLSLIIVPRHIERISEIEKIVQQNNLRSQRFSSVFKKKRIEDAVLLVDSIGQLRKLYPLSDFVFIGKTFAVGGGQNMIEPLYFGKPTFVGPLTQNFKKVVDLFKKEDAIFVVNTPEDLSVGIRAMLKDPKKIEEFSERAKGVVEKYQGATKKTIEEIACFLKG